MYPKVNQNIVIEIKNCDKSFRSIVADIGNKDMLIGIPLDRENIGLIMDGTELNIFFSTNENLYKFSTRMIEKTKDKIQLYRITKPDEKEIKKIQRRDNFRIRTSLPLILNETELKTIDLSVGGVLISSRLDIEVREGESVTGIIYIPNLKNKITEAIPFQGRIKRIEVIKERERKNIAIEFTDVEKRDQMKITQYCFERQREMCLTERKR